ncbi:hypothetical protein GCM10010330_24700 [Streptomyces tendae]|uniref:hypothetical protein n=1 Tax=Streptomyces tendae TaxID=1932 RepID=UPI001996374A|nr:hypothetical protein GCM10010330_24700 [Streptomyces tendae]
MESDRRVERGLGSGRENADREAVRLFLADGVTDVESRTRTLLTCIDELVSAAWWTVAKYSEW